MNKIANRKIAYKWQIKILFLLCVVVVLTGADLIVKDIVQEKLKAQPDIVVIPGFWSFHYTENYDIGFSVLRFLDKLLTAKQKYFFIVILQLSGTALACGFYFYLKDWKFSIPLACIISGGLGNVLNRIMQGYVVDYVKWYIGSFVWPIFNLADVYGVCGLFVLIVVLIFFSSEDSGNNAASRPHSV